MGMNIYIIIFLGVFLTACSHLMESKKTENLFPHYLLEDPFSKGGTDKIFLQTQADYHYSLGESLSFSGNPEAAIKEFKLTLTYDPESTLVRLRLAAEYLKSGKLDKAIKQAEEAVQKDEQSEEGRLLLGGIYTSMRMYEKAINQYKKILEFHPHHFESHLHIGALLAEQKQYAEAKKIFLKLVKSPNSKESHIPHYYLGRIYLEQGGRFLSKSEKTLRNSLRLKPDYENAVLALMRLYELQERQKKAVDLAHSFQERFGPRKRMAGYLNRIYLKKGEHKKALEQLRYLESFDKNDLSIKVRLALILIEQKNLKEAAYKLEEILVMDPELSKIRFYLAMVYKELGETAPSIKHFLKIPLSSSYYVESVIHLVHLYNKQGQSDEAIEVIKKALNTHKDIPQLYTFYALLLDDKKDYKVAITVLSGAVKLFPKDTQIKFLLGTMFDRNGQLDLMIIQMNQILELDRNHIQALNYLAYTYAEQGGALREAEELARRALELQPKDAYILDTMGWVLFKGGQIKKAIPFLERAHRSKPSESVIAEHLGDAYRQIELVEKAKQMYKRAVETASGKKKEEIRAKIMSIEKESKRNLASPKEFSPVELSY